MCGSNASLITTAKPKAKEHFRIAGVLLFYIKQNISLTENICFFRSITMRYFRALQYVSVVSIPPRIFVQLLSIFSLFYEIKGSGVGGVLI